MKSRSSCALFCLFLAAGCAANKHRAAPVVEERDTVYLAPLAVPAAVDSLLAPLGWTPGRFASELGKEIRFQLNRKGVATPQDSTRSRSRLEVRVEHYDPGDYAIKGRLTTPAGTRDIGFAKQSGAAEREDPTIDNIRLIAGNLAEQVRTDPKQKKGDKTDYPIWMMAPL